MAELSEAATAFAGELTGVFRSVLGSDAPAFVAEAATTKSTQRVVVHPEVERVPLRVEGIESLSLSCWFHCEWDARSAYLKVPKSAISVSPISERAAPLLRYEYIEGSPVLPGAHLQIHAHRDEFLFAMMRADHGKPKLRRQSVLGQSEKAVPQLANLHFPLGGPRFRPCLEDVFQFLIVELGVDVTPDALKAIASGRQRWRRRQVAAATRDAPAEAARVLRELGYQVTAPAGGEPDENTPRLSQA